MRIRTIARRLVVGVLLVIGGTAASGAWAAEPLTIRHLDFGLPNLLSPNMFANRDIMKHLDKSYRLELIHFSGSSQQIPAFAAGELDIGTLGFSSFAAAVQNAHLDDLRIVADGFEDGVGDHFSTPFYVRTEDSIRTIEDLKGKVLASNAIGGALDIALRAMLRKHGLEDKRDVTIIEAQFPSMAALLREHKADLVGNSPPFIYDPAFMRDARKLFDMRDAVGPTQMIVFVARSGFLDKNRAAVEDFFEDMIRGTRWFLDPANHEKAVEIVAKVLKQPPERLAYLFTNRDFYHAPDGHPNMQALQHDMETQVSLGFLRQNLDVAKYVDFSFLDEAARRLK